jgi:hypothetical protein
MMTMPGTVKIGHPYWEKIRDNKFQVHYTEHFNIDTKKSGYNGHNGEERHVTLNLVRDWKKQNQERGENL